MSKRNNKFKLEQLAERVVNTKYEQKFCESFDGIIDSEEYDGADVEDIITNFVEEMGGEQLVEAYDISNKNLKKGTTLEFYSVEDLGTLASGVENDIKKYFVDGGSKIEIDISSDTADTFNGVLGDVGIFDGSLSHDVRNKIKHNLENENLDESVKFVEATKQEKVEYPQLSEDELVGLSVNTEIPVEESKEVFEALSELNVGEDRLFESLNQDTKKKLMGMMNLKEESTPANVAGRGATNFGNNPDNISDKSKGSGDLGDKEELKEEFDPNKISDDANKSIEKLLSSGDKKDLLFNISSIIAKDQGLTMGDGELKGDAVASYNDAIDWAKEKYSSVLTEVWSPANATDFENKILSNLGGNVKTSPIKADDGIYKDDSNVSLMDIDGKKVAVVLADDASVTYKVLTESSDQMSPKNYADMIIFNEDGQVLLAKRNENDELEPNKYGFIGGKIEDGESPLDGALRETIEECGLMIHDAEPVAVYENEDGSMSHYFAGKVVGATPVLSDEHTEFKFVEMAELSEMEDIIFGNNDRYVEVTELTEASDEALLKKADKLKKDGDKIKELQLKIANMKKDQKDPDKIKSQEDKVSEKETRLKLDTEIYQLEKDLAGETDEEKKKKKKEALTKRKSEIKDQLNKLYKKTGAKDVADHIANDLLA